MAEIKTVIFDLGNVLVDWNPRHLYQQLIDDEKELDHFLSEVCPMSWHANHDRGVPFAENAIHKIEEYPHYEHLIRAWGDRWLDMIRAPIEGSVQLARDLKAAGYGLIGLTNCPEEQFDELCARFGVFEGFDDIVVSGTEKVIKPAPEIYELTIQRAGVAPEELAFLDDSPRNIEAAQKHAIYAIQFINPEQARADLRHCGVKV